MNYRVGRKSKIALLDENGIEVAMFRKGYEKEAQEVCDLLNGVKKFNISGVGVPKGTLCKCGILYKVYNEREGTIVCTCCGKSKLA